MLEDAAQKFVDGLALLMDEYRSAGSAASKKYVSKLEQAEAIKAEANAELARFARGLNAEYADKVRALGAECKSKAEHPEDLENAISFSADFIGGVMSDSIYPTDAENARIRIENSVNERRRKEEAQEGHKPAPLFAPDWWRGATFYSNGSIRYM